MRSARLSVDAHSGAAWYRFTHAEKAFRNAKLRTPALVAYKTVADVAAKVAMFAITVLAARRLSMQDFGVFALGTTLGWLLSVVSDFGVQLHLARAVAVSADDAPVLLRRWGRFRAATSAAVLSVLGAALFAGHVDLQRATALLLFAAAYAATGLLEFLNYFYRGLSRSDIESTFTVGLRIATLATGCGVLLWRPSPIALALAMMAPAMVALTLSAWIARSINVVAFHRPPPHADFLSDVFPIGLGIVLSALYFRVDVLLLEWWTGTRAVAQYNAVFRIVEALRLFPAAVIAVQLPTLSRAHDLRPVIRIASGLTAIAFTAAILLWAVGDRIVAVLYGPAYAPAAPAFRILALAFPLLSMNYALTHQVILWNRQRTYAVICAIALAFNVLVNAWLIPSFAIEGAAWATLGTEAVLTAGCLVALRRSS
jgi:O-antigen/teichoic acid export membrane protein